MQQLPRELNSEFMTFFDVFGLVYVAACFDPGNGAKIKREAPHLHPTHYSASLSLSLKHKKLDWFSIFIPRERWERKKTWESPGPRIERECHKRANIKIWITTLAFFDNTTRRETKKRIIQTAWATCIVGRGSTMVKSKWSMRWVLLKYDRISRISLDRIIILIYMIFKGYLATTHLRIRKGPRFWIWYCCFGRCRQSSSTDGRYISHHFRRGKRRPRMG